MKAIVRILLVEENQRDAKVVRDAFLEYWPDAPLTIFEDCNSALAALRSERELPEPKLPCVILLSFNGAQTNEMHFLRELRYDPLLKRRTVFMLSDTATEEDVLAAYDWQIAGYILKAKIAENGRHLINLLQSYVSIVEFPQE